MARATARAPTSSRSTPSARSNPVLAEIVNLRLARKRKVRADHDVAAAEARAAHGRTKAEKLRDKALRARETASLDGHRLTKPDA
jgi:hypothetical protein